MMGMFEKRITEKICALDKLIEKEFGDYVEAYRQNERSLLSNGISKSFAGKIRQDLSMTGLSDVNQQVWCSRIAFLSLEKRVLEQAAGFKGSGLSAEDWLKTGNNRENKARALFRSVDPVFFTAALEGDNGKRLLGADEVRRYRDNLMPDCKEAGIGMVRSPQFDGLVVRKLVDEIAEEVKEWEIPYLL